MYFPSTPETLMKATTYDLKVILVQSLSDTYPVCQRVFSLLFAAKIERRSRDRDEEKEKKNPLAPSVSDAGRLKKPLLQEMLYC